MFLFQLAGPLRNSGTCNSVCLPAENPKIFRTVFDEQDMMGLDDLNNGHKDDQSTGFTHITGSSDLHMRMNVITYKNMAMCILFSALFLCSLQLLKFNCPCNW